MTLLSLGGSWAPGFSFWYYQIWLIPSLLNERRNLMNIRTRLLSATAILGITLLASSTANAKDEIDGSANLICAAFDVMACLEGGKCARGEARSFEMPEFMNVDFKKKMVHATYDSESEKTANSPIKNSEVSGNQLILQGVENNHGWTMAINRESGRMSLAVVGYEVSFSIFGACKAL
jgi:hypothetical protein